MNIVKPTKILNHLPPLVEFLSSFNVQLERVTEHVMSSH